MEYFITKENINNYLKIPKSFDWNWVDQELGFDKIFNIIPSEVYQAISAETDDANKEIFRLLTKAAVHYAFVLDIPRLKLQISNAGIDNVNQEKLKPANYYDVRDLGLKYLKTADQCFSKAITLLKGSTFEDAIPFFSKTNGIISTPAEFNAIYSINNSPEVFLQLLPLLKRAEENYITKQLKPCTIANITEKESATENLKTALAYYTLHYAASLPAFTLLSNAVVIQYEELPWQKSMVLSEDARNKAAHKFLDFAEENMKNLIDTIKENPTDFPCYVEEKLPDFSPIKKKSGLYL